MNESSSCPPYGRNSLGVARRINGKTPLVRIEHIGPANMLICREVGTLTQLSIHASFFEPMPAIPSKYREYNFIHLAPYWSAALNAFPKQICIQPSTVSPETLVRKLRESRVAKDTYGWRHDSVNEERWKQFASSLVIATDGAQVFIGPPQADKENNLIGEIVQTNDIPVHWSNTEQLEAFCAFLTQHMLTIKPNFVIHGLTESLIADLENRYDIGFVPREDGAFSVIY